MIIYNDLVFIEILQRYKYDNKKKIKIISIIRNPFDRLPSSFFQSYHTDEIIFLDKLIFILFIILYFIYIIIIIILIVK